MDKEYITHSGVKGMKWGVWNEETRRRYGFHKQQILNNKAARDLLESGEYKNLINHYNNNGMQILDALTDSTNYHLFQMTSIAHKNRIRNGKRFTNELLAEIDDLKNQYWETDHWPIKRSRKAEFRDKLRYIFA